MDSSPNLRRRFTGGRTKKKERNQKEGADQRVDERDDPDWTFFYPTIEKSIFPVHGSLNGAVLGNNDRLITYLVRLGGWFGRGPPRIESPWTVDWSLSRGNSDMDAEIVQDTWLPLW